MSSSSNENEYEEEVMYRCKHCPNLTFTAAERDTHRQQHRRNRGDRRVTGPAQSDVTLFEVIKTTPPPSEGRSSGKRRSKLSPTRKPGPASKKNKPTAKKRSEKRYDHSVVAERNGSG